MRATFDDAYESIELVVPDLMAMEVPILVFVCTAFADEGGAPLRVGELVGATSEDLVGLKTMSWDQLRDIAARGAEIGSHTVSHPHLTTLSDSELRAELVDSKRRIEAQIGVPCQSIAYPYGEHDDRVRTMTREAGYERGYAVNTSVGGTYGLPRLELHRRDRVPRALLKAVTLVPRAWRGDGAAS